MTPQTSRIDLHIHTTVSDGTDRPEELLPKVREKGIELFSVTDHDAIKSSKILMPLLRKDDPEFITGVEFSCRDDFGKYHILGYGYDPAGDSITKLMDEPVRQPTVRKMKYNEVAKAASLSDIPKRSMRIFGAVVFVPTSMPT